MEDLLYKERTCPDFLLNPYRVISFPDKQRKGGIGMVIHCFAPLPFSSQDTQQNDQSANLKQKPNSPFPA